MRNTFEYPQLFSVSEQASKTDQKIYLRLLVLQILLLLVASFIGGAGGLFPESKGRLASLNALLLAAGLILMWIIRLRRYESRWLRCRVIAESVKTAVWRYVMQAPPYNSQRTL